MRDDLPGKICLARTSKPAIPWPVNKLDRIAWLLLLVAGVAVAVAGWCAFRFLPYWSWSAVRLSASVRLAYGFPLYTAPGGATMNDWFYGPVAPLAYLPAALASDPLGALRVAAVLNAFYFLFPLGWIVGGLGRGAAPAWTRWAGLVFCTGAFLLPFGLWYGAASLHVDTVAIGLGVLSCAALVRPDRLPLAALLCVLTAWTKQTDFPLAIAQLIFLARLRGGRTALRYTGWLAGWAAGITAIFCAWFGAGTLWHVLIVLQTRFPIDTWRLGAEWASFAPHGAWILLLVLGLWRGLPPPAAERARREYELGWLLCGSGLVLLPVGFLAAIKNGGTQNSIHALAYGILGVTVLGLLWLNAAQGRLARQGQLALLGGMVLVAALGAGRVLRNGDLHAVAIGEQHREAFEFVRAHPHQVYVPWNPLITLMAERREYPFECAYHDYLMVHDAPAPAEMRRVFPPTLAYVIYFHGDQPPLEIMSLFPEFSRRRSLGNWTIYSRPADPPRP